MKKQLISIVIWLTVVFVGKDIVIPRSFFLLDWNCGEYTYISAFIQYVWMIIVTYIFSISGEGIQAKKENRREDTEKINYIETIIIVVALFLFMRLIRYAIDIFIYIITGNMLYPIGVSSIELNELLTLILIQCIWAVIAEEYVYRCVMYADIKTVIGKQYSAFIVSLCFSIAHNSIEQMIQAFIISLILCMVYDRYNSLVLCIFIHTGYNILGVLQAYIYDPFYNLLYSAIEYNTLFENTINIFICILTGMTAALIIMNRLCSNFKLERNFSKRNLGVSIGICMFFCMVQILKYI